MAEGAVLWAKGGFVGLVVGALRPGLGAVMAGEALGLVSWWTGALWERGTDATDWHYEMQIGAQLMDRQLRCRGSMLSRSLENRRCGSVSLLRRLFLVSQSGFTSRLGTSRMRSSSLWRKKPEDRECSCKRP